MVFTEDHEGHKDRIPRTYSNDLSVFATFVAFLLVLLRLLCPVRRYALIEPRCGSMSYRNRTDEQELIPTDDGLYIYRKTVSAFWCSTVKLTERVPPGRVRWATLAGTVAM